MFTNCRSINEGAVVSENIDETSIIIRCNTHQVQMHNRLGGSLYIMSLFIDVH